MISKKDKRIPLRISPKRFLLGLFDITDVVERSRPHHSRFPGWTALIFLLRGTPACLLRTVSISAGLSQLDDALSMTFAGNLGKPLPPIIICVEVSIPAPG